MIRTRTEYTCDRCLSQQLVYEGKPHPSGWAKAYMAMPTGGDLAIRRVRVDDSADVEDKFVDICPKCARSMMDWWLSRNAH